MSQITTPSSSVATATSPKGSATRRRRSPAISASVGSSRSTTTTTYRSTAPPSSALSDDAPKRFAAYGWNVIELGERGRGPRRHRGRAAHGDGLDRCPVAGGAAQPHRHAVAHQDRRPRRPRLCAARRRHRRHQGGARPPRRRDLLRPRRRRRHLPRGRCSAAAMPDSAWEARIADRTDDRAVLDACLAGRGLPGWEATLPHGTVGEQVATRKASGSCLIAAAAEVPGLIAGSADLTVQHRHRARRCCSHLRRGTRWAPTALRGSRARHGFGHDGYGAARRHPPRRAAPSWCSATTCARRSASPRSARPRSSTRSPTTRWASARTAPRISPSSSSCRCAPFPGCGSSDPPTPTRPRRHGGSPSTASGPTALILTRQNVPVLEGTDAEATDRGAYVLRDVDGSRSRAHRHRFGGLGLRRRSRGARSRRHRRSGRVDAQLGSVRMPRSPTYVDAVLPPTVPDGVDRGRRDARLGALGRHRDRHRPVRCVGSGQYGHGEARHHRRAPSSRPPRRPSTACSAARRVPTKERALP